MPWIGMYLLEQDVEFLNDWLNQEEEIAFLMSDGPRRWVAREECNILTTPAIKTGLRDYELLPEEIAATVPGKMLVGSKFDFELWHIPSGPLPLIGSASITEGETLGKDEDIKDPWQGWEELRAPANAKIPFFASHPGALRLTIRLHPTMIIPVSSFQWTGNYFRISGIPANVLTEKFWKRLRQMVTKVAIKLPRENKADLKPEIFAFPQAYQEIMTGRPCALNPNP